MRLMFIGLGTMGAPMVRCLVDRGIDVVGWDAEETTRARFDFCVERLELGLADVDAVVTMLPEGTDVAEVFQGGVFEHARSSTLLIDCSTIDVTTTRMLSEEAAERGFAMIDAPVSGGAKAARHGTLSFMTGGPEEALQRALPILDITGKSATHFGPAGSGQAAKACHNMICGITALGVCEAFALADALGLDAGKFFELCKGAAAQSWILENRCPVPGPAPAAPSSNDYAMRRDLLPV